MATVTRPLSSSWLRSARWDDETKEMVLGTPKGSYVFHGVPKDIFNALCDAPSAGDYYHANIKGNYA